MQVVNSSVFLPIDFPNLVGDNYVNLKHHTEGINCYLNGQYSKYTKFSKYMHCTALRLFPKQGPAKQLIKGCILPHFCYLGQPGHPLSKICLP